MIFLLKIQLIEAGILNHNLKRVISTHEWKKALERGTYKINESLLSMFKNNCEKLESILNQTCESHELLRSKMEKWEYQQGLQLNFATPGFEDSTPKARIIKSVTKRSMMRFNANYNRRLFTM